MSTVLITGAFGQVGKRCAEILLQRGNTVVALDLDNEKTRATAAELGAAGPGVLVPAFVNLLDGDAIAALMKLQEELSAPCLPSTRRKA